MWKSFENIGLQTSEKVSWEKKKETCAKHKIDRSQNGRSNKYNNSNTCPIYSNIHALWYYFDNRKFLPYWGRVCTHIKMLFPGLAKTKYQGFPWLKNPFSRTFQDMFHSQTWVAWGRYIYKITYQCICITVKKRKCNTCGYIIVLQWTQISSASSRGGNVLHVIA